ncbi:hypothetical protein SCYAM73S_03877 [Streptomyces cyaneofuscatus]
MTQSELELPLGDENPCVRNSGPARGSAAGPDLGAELRFRAGGATANWEPGTQDLAWLLRLTGTRSRLATELSRAPAWM